MVEKLMNEARKHFSLEEMMLIKKAYIFACDLHKGQFRQSGEAYVTHPIAVAYILLYEMHLWDANSIIAALLHDTIEDSGITKEFIEQHFNSDVAFLVASVSKIKNIDFQSKTEEEQYNTCVLLRGLMNDYRVILIKLADRIHNMRTMIYKGDKKVIDKFNAGHSTLEDMKLSVNEKQKEKSKETMTLFVPLADYVGARLVRRELEDLSFLYINNQKYREIRNNLIEYVTNNQEEIEKMLNNIINILDKMNISHNITMRLKTNFDTYRNLKKYHKLANIPGLISYEIVVDNIEECYLALGCLNHIYHPENAIVRDYISVARPNGYEAIHTLITSENGLSIEIKICSKEMDLLNNYGLAILNTRYKNLTIEEIKNNLNQNNKFIAALRSIDSLYQKDDEFMDQISKEILTTQIKVLSKDGESYFLPKGATVLDFAYKIHTEVGNSADGALVNGKQVALNHILKDGDIVNVIVSPGRILPDEDALDYVITAKAKKKIHEGRNRCARIRKLVSLIDYPEN